MFYDVFVELSIGLQRKGNERIGEIPENQGKCQDNELPMRKLMRFPFEDRNHRIGGDNYDNKLRSVAMRPI